MELGGDWQRPDTKLVEAVKRCSAQSLAAYGEDPTLVAEHANIERSIAQGGYGRRQLYELVQNGADALRGWGSGGAIKILLTSDALYCANEGRPVDENGVLALLHSHLSEKRGLEIGRFGLGFKSVLEVTDRPQIYSRSVSFGFDREFAARQIHRIVPTAERTPCLRVAEVLDPVLEAKADPELAALMEWAATVIRMPRHPSRGKWLSDDMRDFPAEFLLFSPHVREVVLEDRTSGLRRAFRIQQRDALVLLEDNGSDAQVWKVYSTMYRPSIEARSEAGELADREELSFMWAVPLQGRTERGEFWAFFPTKYRTTLSGILNAPWKTNEDRQNLLESRFNEELIGAAAALIVKSLPDLATSFPGDLGRFLSLLPARGREAPNWADELLTAKVYEGAARAPSLPDQTGELRIPMTLKMPPDSVPDEARAIWASCSWRPTDWVHIDVLSAIDRRSRVRRLIEVAGGLEATVVEWLEALTDVDDELAVDASVAAIKAAGEIVETQSRVIADHVLEAKIVLSTDGEWLAPLKDKVFIGSGTGVSSVPTVHDEVLEGVGVRAALARLGIGEVDATSELRQFLIDATPEDIVRNDKWQTFWLLARRAPDAMAESVISEWAGKCSAASVVHALNAVGEWVRLDDLLLPGGVVPQHGNPDNQVTIDVTYHGKELGLLKALGAVSGPESGGASVDEKWFGNYRKAALETYRRELARYRSRPQESYLVFDRAPATGPLNILLNPGVSDETKVRYTEALLPSALQDAPWEFHHETRQRYPRIEVDAPSVWVVKRFGYLNTSLGPMELGKCVGEGLGRWSVFLPVADCSYEVQRGLGLAQGWDTLPPRHVCLGLLRAGNVPSEHELGAFYVEACTYWPDPQFIWCRVGDGFDRRAPADVMAVADYRVAAVCASQEMPYVVVGSAASAEALMETWNLKNPSHSVSVEVHRTPSGRATPLEDAYLGLSLMLDLGDESPRLIPCSSLWEEVSTPAGRVVEDLTFVQDGDSIYYSDRLGEDKLLEELARRFNVELSEDDFRAIQENRAVEARRAQMAEIRSLGTLGERLLAALGPERVRQRLPQTVLEAATARTGAPSDLELANLALGVYGTETLFEYRTDLRDAGFVPPNQWAGSYQARQFVQALGFPREFGGFGGEVRDATLDVDGPVALPPLHGFQEAALARVRDLLKGTQDDAHGRGLLSLPTGAGKTRIAVEATVRAMKEDGLESPVLWIAQSEELCEQAVQAWREVWRSSGPPQPLRVNRFWGANDADQADRGHQVVVATMQKLSHRIEQPEYAWLAEASFAIIDEAHHAITPSYTRILHWLGLVRRDTPRPLLGLTATPFRGGEAETERLAARFSKNRLDAGLLGEDTYAELQRMGVLAEVDHRLLIGSDVELDAREISQIEATGWLPRSAEQRLGNDVSRTGMLLDSLLDLSDDWPVLVFATSVDNAHTLAALLNNSGVPSASIYADMRTAARRHYIEQFRNGGLRVLTNYGVLTTGFDAPAVRALYVARPTFSPVLYQQMIGRGLRGPRNGGKERCLIVNVDDTFRQFGSQLAFKEFEFLWGKA